MTFEEFLQALTNDIMVYVNKQISYKQKSYIPNWNNDPNKSAFEESSSADVGVYKVDDTDNYSLNIFLTNLPTKINIQKYLIEKFGINKKGFVGSEEIKRESLRSLKTTFLYSNYTSYRKLKYEDLNIIYKKLQNN